MAWQPDVVSKSSPADLAIAFRSLDRRRREAIGDSDPTDVADLAAALDEHIATVASRLGTEASASAVGNELERRHSDEWDESLLDDVRQHATDAGVVVRRIAERVEASNPDR